MEMLKYLLWYSLFALCNAAVFQPDFERKLVSYIEENMKCHHIPGMALSVVKGDEIWSHGFGKEDIYSGKNVDRNSLFDIGSITKSFTATLLGIMLTENGYDWSTKVTRILGPEYQFVDDYRTKELTMRDLLSHRTGLSRLDMSGGLAAGIPTSISRSEFCKLMKYLPEELPVRDGFIYNNYMFMMLGHVAEVLGNDTWENLVTTKLFQPLGMTNTTILKAPADVIRPGVAKPTIFKDGQFQNGTFELYRVHPEEPAAAILSSAVDMTKWIKFNLKRGKTETGVQLLDAKLMDDIHRVTTAQTSAPSLVKPTFPISDITLGYGYGWEVSEYRGYRRVWHSGGVGCYISLLWTFPDMDIGLFASVNGPGNAVKSSDHNTVSFYYITDHLFGVESWLNETTSCTFSMVPGNTTLSGPASQETPIQVDNLADFEGVFGNHLFPDMKIYSNTTHLLFDQNRLHGILQPSSEKDRFLFVLIKPYEYSSGNLGVVVNGTFHRNMVTNIVSSLDMQAIQTKVPLSMKYEKGISLTQGPSKPPVNIG